MTRAGAIWLLAAAVGGGACAREGDVLTTVGADGAVDGAGADADPCALAGPCPDPDPGDVTLCGRVVDVETSQPVTGGEPEVRVFDLQDLLLDPFDADELAVVAPDACGWFSTTIRGVLGMTVIHTGELLGGDPYQRAVSLVEAPPGQRVVTNAFVLRAETDQAWSEQAGLTGATVAEGGAVLAIYVDLDVPAVGPFQGGPVGGVVATEDGATAPGRDYYFADADPLSRGQIAPALAATGVDGAALLLAPTGTFDLGGEKTGCEFAPAVAVSMPTMVQVQELLGHCQ